MKNRNGEYVAELHNHTAFHERLSGTVKGLSGVDNARGVDASIEGIRFIESCLDEAYRKAGRTRQVRLIRFPYGAAPSEQFADRYRALFEELDLHALNWTNDAKDYEMMRGSGLSEEHRERLRTQLREAQNTGGVYLGHDKTWERLRSVISEYTGSRQERPVTPDVSPKVEEQAEVPVQNSRSFTTTKECGTYYQIWLRQGRTEGYTDPDAYYDLIDSLNKGIDRNALPTGKTIQIPTKKPQAQTVPSGPEQTDTTPESIERIPLNRHESLIAGEFYKQGYSNRNQLQYILATARHETDGFNTMKEYSRGSGKKYGQTYYGRGYAQLTWESGYRKYQKVLTSRGLLKEGENIITNPDIVTRPEIAAFIIVHGMMTGHFTGKSLPQYINGKNTDFWGARRTVNGTDKASQIARIAREYGTKLDPDSSPRSPEVSPNEAFVVVEAGDTLFSIGRRVGMSVADLKAKNGLTSDLIGVGDRLVINET